MAEELQFVAPDGTVTVLTDLVDDIDLLEGVTGRFAAPVELTADPVVGLDGARLRGVRAGVRDIILPIAVETGGEQALRTRLRQLVSTVWPTRGAGKLRAVRDDTSRQILVRYAGGLEVVEDYGSAVSGWVNTGLVFRAFDPYWEDSVPDVRVLQVDALAFLSPDVSTAWFPWQTVDVDVVGGFTVDNDGEDESWPVWTVQGPGGPLTVSNVTTGLHTTVDTVLTAGQQLTIDTRPDFKTVVGPAGTNLWPDVSDTSELWPLVRGQQTVQVELAGAEAGVSNVRLEFRRRWYSP